MRRIFLAIALMMLVMQANTQAKTFQNIYSLSRKQVSIPTIGAYGIPAYAMLSGNKRRGTYLSFVDKSGVAYKTGLRTGDVLLSLNNRVTDTPSKANSLAAELSGKKLRITLARQAGATLAVKTINTTWHTSMAVARRSSVAITGMSGLRRPKRDVPVSRLESYMHGLVNDDRRANGGFSSLRYSNSLAKVARAHAEDMVERNYFQHQSPDGLYAYQRAQRAGINAHIAENLSYARDATMTPEQLVKHCEDTMMAEPPNQHNHRGNILDPDHRCVGVGVAYAEDGSIKLVQLFSHDNLP